jgi:hypothetical protein
MFTHLHNLNSVDSAWSIELDPVCYHYDFVCYLTEVMMGG